MSLAGVLRSKTFTVLLGLALVVGVLWVALPPLATRYVNRKLASLEDYTGSVDSVSLNLWRGAYRLENLRLDARRPAGKRPFFRADAIDLSLDSRALLRGSLVAEIDLHEPVLNYVAAPKSDEEERSWQQAMADFAPFRINRFTVHDGKITYRKPGSKSQTLTLDEVRAVVRDLTNSADLDENRHARFEGNAVVLGSGALTFEGKADPSASTPTFDLDLELDDLKLDDAANLLPGRAGFRAEGGTLSLTADLTAARGRVRGVAETHLEGLQLANVRRKEENVIGKLWDKARDLAEPYVGGKETREARARIPIDFRLNDPQAGLLAAANEVVQTALTRAITRSLEDALPYGLPQLRREN